MKVDNVEFDLEAGKIVSSKQITLAEQSLKNNSDGEQEMSFSVDKSVANSSTFEYISGFTATIGMEFKGVYNLIRRLVCSRLMPSAASIPFVTGNELAVEVLNVHTWTWGKTTHHYIKYTAALPIKAGARKSVRVSSVVNQGEREVPFTMHLSSKRTAGVKVQTTGTWRGVSSWDHRNIITALDSFPWA